MADLLTQNRIHKTKRDTGLPNGLQAEGLRGPVPSGGGGIIYVHRPLRRTEKVFAIAAYLIFALMNFVALRAGQRLTERLRADLATVSASSGQPSQTSALFEASSGFFPYQEAITLVIHLVAAVLVIGAIVHDRARPSSVEADGEISNRQDAGDA